MPRQRSRPHLATSDDLPTQPTNPYWTLWLALITAPLVWWG